ncbi:hypothetical protein HBF26_17215 [Luteibacter jiangsuensis]|uniref:Uncharacterized protein n=1 Tax=Luteibacter jiangsuensis TaxID=637577 RepID=A0ABX0Q7V0_9GAMM|nr:hypothetical protein [Luteibacter jiangsuensis]NID06638.1 hypothetical protein [Luteibacter jiangsuensis]
MKTSGEWLDILEHSWREAMETHGGPEQTRDEFLSMHVFGFTTYDGDQDATLAARAVDVCRAISAKATYEYINRSQEDYTWYLVMCNMPFFSQAISWGTSIRGAWWSAPYDSRGHRPIKLDSCGIYDGDEQLLGLEFTTAEWEVFIEAVIDFASAT